MKHLHITHARIINSNVPAFGVNLNIKVPCGKLNEAREYIKEQYNADRVNLTYKEYEPVR